MRTIPLVLSLMGLCLGLQAPAYAQLNCTLPLKLLPVAIFKIPSGSMLPTLAINSIIGAQCYAMPPEATYPVSLDVIHPRIRVGDIVVFKLPIDPTQLQTKRIVGMPGDSVQMRGGYLYINGQKLPRDLKGSLQVTGDDGKTLVLHRYTETLPNGVSYDILKESDAGPLDNTFIYHVPPGYLFVMGDNRDDSLDSRVLDAVGYIPFENLVARVLGED